MTDVERMQSIMDFADACSKICDDGKCEYMFGKENICHLWINDGDIEKDGFSINDCILSRFDFMKYPKVAKKVFHAIAESEGLA